MIDTIAWPTLALPKKSMIAAVLASIVLATTLVVAPAPLPLMDNATSALAHTDRQCFTTTVLESGTGGWFRGRGGVRSYVPARYFEQTSCVNVAHNHWWQQMAVYTAVGVGCGTFTFAVGSATAGIGGFAAGFACGGVMAGALASTSFH